MKRYGKPIVFALVLIAFSAVAAAFPVRDWIRALVNWMEQLGPAGVAVFIGIYAIATVLLFPGWIFTVTAGLIFGVVGGTAAALSGATLGAALAFLVARYLVRDSIQKFAKSYPRFQAIDQAIGTRTHGPILLNSHGTRMDRHAATRRLRRLAEIAGVRIARPHPHMLRHTFVTTMLDAGVDLRDVQIAARHADPRTTMRYDRARKNLDRHPNYILAAYMASGT